MSEKKKAEGETIADKVRGEFAERKYFRDPKNGILGGVLAGFSAYTGWDLTLLRILLVLLVICTAFFPFCLLYIVVWICAPAAETAADYAAMKGKPIKTEDAKKAVKNAAEKIEKGAKATEEKISQAAPAAGNLALRIVLGFFGVIGLLIFIPILMALIPTTILGIFHVAAAEIASKPLFVVTIILLAILTFLLVLMGIVVSVALICAKLGRSTKVGLVVSVALAIVLMMAAALTGGIWTREAGRDGVVDTAKALTNGYIVEVDGGGTLRVDVGPIKINTRFD